MNTTTLQDPYEAAQAALAEQTGPQSWKWDEDGDELAGVLRGDDEGETKEGAKVPIKVIRTRDGALRSLWLFETPKLLRDLFAEHDPKPGDFLIVQRGATKLPTKDGERSYWPFSMAVVPASGGSDVHAPLAINAADAETQVEWEREQDEIDAAASEWEPQNV